jgi:two-component system NarL family sensor kinase
MSKQEYEIVTGIVVTIVVFLLAGFFIMVLVAYINRRKKKHMEEKQTMQLNFEQELLRTQLVIQEQTLKNISEEIHDNIGQILSLAKLQLATMDASPNAVLQSKIQDSKLLVAKAIQDLRDLSHSLNTDFVKEMGFARAVESELDMLKKSELYETSFSIIGKISKMDRQKELILFRIVQELLSNIMKHAKARKIEMTIDYQPDHLLLTISDDGEGFDSSKPSGNDKSGLGIRNMHNRARIIGAEFAISSNFGKGTTASIVLPMSIPKPI